MPHSRESRFIAGQEGIEDKKYPLVNKLKDVQNLCGRQFNPDQEDYWKLMKDELKDWSEEDLDYLFSQYHLLGESGDKIRDTVRSIWRERREERVKKDFKEEQEKRTNSKGKDDLRDAAKKAFEGTDFKHFY